MIPTKIRRSKNLSRSFLKNLSKKNYFQLSFRAPPKGLVVGSARGRCREDLRRGRRSWSSRHRGRSPPNKPSGAKRRPFPRAPGVKLAVRWVWVKPVRVGFIRNWAESVILRLLESNNLRLSAQHQAAFTLSFQGFLRDLGFLRGEILQRENAMNLSDAGGQTEGAVAQAISGVDR